MKLNLALAMTFPLCIATAANADEQLIGSWCWPTANDEILYTIEANSLGVRESTTCDWGAPPTGQTVSTQIECRNMRFYEGEWVATDEASYDFFAEVLANGTLRAQIGDQDSVVLHRCNH